MKLVVSPAEMSKIVTVGLPKFLASLKIESVTVDREYDVREECSTENLEIEINPYQPEVSNGLPS